MQLNESFHLSATPPQHGVPLHSARRIGSIILPVGGKETGQNHTAEGLAAESLGGGLAKAAVNALPLADAPPAPGPSFEQAIHAFGWLP